MTGVGLREYPVRLVGLIVLAILMVPTLAFAGVNVWVYTANNAAAEKIEERLLALEVPAHSEILDSSWKVSRFSGAGNGAQRAGALLLRSNLESGALENFYAAQAGGHAIASSVEDRGLVSALFDTDGDLQQPGYFIIYAIDEPTSGLLRDYDIRGH